MNFPKRIEQHKHESDSFAIILYELREIGIFRNITESDYGIDFEIEVVNGNQVESHCVKVQVKSSDKLKIRKKDGHAKVGGIKQSTLYYWAELSYAACSSLLRKGRCSGVLPEESDFQLLQYDVLAPVSTLFVTTSI